jgi:hypothetical protein
MTRYEINISEFDNSEIIKRINDDGSESWIPKDTANSDYQEYLKWVEEQNA